MSRSDLHSAWAKLFLASLAGSGVRDVVLSPGSRSTPLAIAAAREDRLRLHVLVDERVAAFFALGQARTSGRPSVLICTSGSAAAHYLPALVEAVHSHIPLIVVTADRPWDAYDCTASQTIDQVKLFGDHVRHYADLGLPDAQPSALAAVVRIAAQAVARSQGPVPGPVHVNAHFRKPLEPVSVADREPHCDWVDALLAKGPPRVFASPQSARVDEHALRSLALLCAERPRGIIVCGPAWSGTDAAKLREALSDLVRATGWGVWAEATSSVRFGVGLEVQGAFDAFLRSEPLRAALAPQILVELGGPPVSSSYAQFVERHPDCVRAVVAPHGWKDPSGRADLLISADPAVLCRALAQHPLLTTVAWPSARAAYQSLLQQIEARTWSVVDEVQRDEELSEGAVVASVLAAAPAGSVLLLGNSLAVRDVDLFGHPSAKSLRVLHQRGAAGIDGLIAAAAGSRTQTADPVLVLLGDVSAQHDIGGLAALQQVAGPLVVVVINNAGGRIFEQLPVASSAAAQRDFARLFVAPQQIDFAAAAHAFGVSHRRVHDPAALRSALSDGFADTRPLLLECCVPPEDGRTRRQQIWQRVIDEIRPLPAAKAAQPPRLVTPCTTVFLHGFLGSPAMWDGLVSALNRPYRTDVLPGHGQLPRCPAQDFDDVIADMAASLPEGGCELVGYSMGARLALALALHVPDRVHALTLIGVDPGFSTEEPDERQRRVAWEDELAARLATHGLAAFVEHWEQLPIFATQRQLSPSAWAQQRQQRMAQDPAGLAWALRTLGTGRMPCLWTRLSRLRIPVRLISGSRDEKFVRIGRRLQDCVPGLTHVVLPDIGHNVVLEAPEHLLHILRTPHGHIEQ